MKIVIGYLYKPVIIYEYETRVVTLPATVMADRGAFSFAGIAYLSLTVLLILQTSVDGKDYLVAIHRKSYTYYSSIVVYTWRTGGMMQIQYPSYQHKESYRLYDTYTARIEEKMGTLQSIESNTIVVTCSNHEAKILVHSDNFRSNIFSPLPVTALGKRYIVSSCDPSGQYRPFLVIATHKEETAVDISFNTTGSVSYDGRSYRDGDKLSLTLGAYQTFTFESYYGLTGSVINSTHTIALFTGLLNTTSVVAYDQLLPVEYYSTEYVVAVDDNTSPYNLQIISDKKKTRITFNNGSSVFMNESGQYGRSLRPSEMFHFTASNPVMTTLCRINGERSGFVLVPPVSNFNSQRRFYLDYTATVLLTSISTEMNFSSPSSISKIWKHIPNSQYKVGEFRTKLSAQVTSDTAFTGSILFYQDYSIYSWGLSTENATSVYTESNDMTTYILAVPTGANVHLTAVGETDAFWQVQYPYKEEWYSGESISFNADYVYIDNEMETREGIENKTILVNAASSDLHIKCCSQHFFYFEKFISFSPLPVSALGTKYIISSCYSPYANSSLLIIANANDPTDVSITFRLEDQSFNYKGKTYTDGDVLSVILQEYQTLTISFQVSVCGSIILARSKIAVFVGHGPNRFNKFFYQILPARLYGKEYVAAVGELNKFYGADLLVISEHNDTQIIFSDEKTASVGVKNKYLRSLKTNESLLFTTSKPVMSSLCMYNKRSRSQFSCNILPSISLHAYSTGMVITQSSEIKLLTERTTNDLQVKRSIGRSWIETVSVDWKDIPNSNYKVGTCTKPWGTFYANSNSRFTILGYVIPYRSPGIFNGGYNFHGLRPETTSVTGSTNQLDTQSSTKKSSIHSINLATNDNATQISTILAVGVTCGFIILVLAVVIGGLFIYIRRNMGWRGQKEDRQHGTSKTNHEQSRPHQETSFTANDASAVANVAVICDTNTYSDLFSEDQCESAYEQISQNNPQYMNIERR